MSNVTLLAKDLKCFARGVESTGGGVCTHIHCCMYNVQVNVVYDSVTDCGVCYILPDSLDFLPSPSFFHFWVPKMIE